MGFTSGLRPILLLLFLGGSWGLYFSMLKIAVLSGISYTGILTLSTVGVAIGMSAIALLYLVGRSKPDAESLMRQRQ
jgi:hypothetical protein